MEKTLVVMGVVTMLIGIGFVVSDLVFQEMESGFNMGSLIWTIGGIAAILGRTIFENGSQLEEFH